MTSCNTKIIMLRYISAPEMRYFSVKYLALTTWSVLKGASVKDLKKAFKEAVEDYLDTCVQLGKTPEKTYKGTFNVRVPATLHKKASLFAAVNNITLNEFVKTALDFTLKHTDEVKRVIDSEGNTVLS